MDDTPGSITALRKEIAQLSQGVKLGFLALLIGASYYNIRTAIYIPPRFAEIYKDMLGSDASLPAETLFVVHNCVDLVVFACVLPAIGITAYWARSTYHAVLTLIILLFLAVIQCHFMWWALGRPLITIIQRMASGSP